MSFHQVIIAGNAGADGELRYTPSGKATASFSVAANREYTNSQGEKVKETLWFRVITWHKLAEICSQYVKKGMKLLVVGHLNADQSTGGPRIWTAQDGSSRASFEVTADTVRFLSSNSMVEAAKDLGGAEEIPF